MWRVALPSLLLCGASGRSTCSLLRSGPLGAARMCAPLGMGGLLGLPRGHFVLVPLEICRREILELLALLGGQLTKPAVEQLGHRWAELSLVAAQPHPERNLTSLAEETERGQRRERPMRPTVALAIGREPNGRALRKVTLPIGRSGGLVLVVRACVCFAPCRHDKSREFGGCRGRMSCKQRGAHCLAE